MDIETILGPRVAIHGACRFTPERAQRGFRLNTFLTGMRQPLQREAFARDSEACMAGHSLTAQEQDMVRRRDYAAMLDYGASNVALGKAGPALGISLLERGAQGRGQTAQEFMAERRAANQGQAWQF